MEKDSLNKIKRMKVDGGMTVNSYLLQLQSDILGIPVCNVFFLKILKFAVKPQNAETTSLGAAFAGTKAFYIKALSWYCTWYLD